jgi:hypothetical protein
MRIGVLLGKSLGEVMALSVEELMLWSQWLGDGEDQVAADARAALICSTLANCHGNKTKVGDFMPQRRPAATAHGEDALKGFFKRLAR